MANSDSDRGLGTSAVINSLLLIGTVIGGWILVSGKLTSERPASPKRDPLGSIGDQRVEARLWEDPFQAPVGAEPSLTNLASQIKAQAGNEVVLMPVMVEGGPYAEDREARIRSRFAVVSALGRSGYAPNDAEHLGEIAIPWPSSRELADWKTNVNAQLPLCQAGASNGFALPNWPSKLQIRYEWYRLRTFVPGTNVYKFPEQILVLWLDDGAFEDDPLLRIPLLLGPLVKLATTNLPPSERMVQMIGPRRSSTLRAMLSNEFADPNVLSVTQCEANLMSQATSVLSNVVLHSSTVSAMDAALVRKPGTNSRGMVSEKLRARGFAEAKFYNATDSEMADEIFKELKLRGVDLATPINHVVLLSEWDTFYGRMLSLTYGATLALRQANSYAGRLTPKSLGEFVDDYRANKCSLPNNFHSLVYLRGLDGQTAGGREGEDNKAKDTSPRKKPQTLEDIVQWTPDANRTEGQSQFDYLSRTGERIQSLQRQLDLSGSGRIRAIGIVGSDTYDVLLILQALRSRFPDVHFFTTDLDARYLQPSQRDWTRNLIVASSHGLRLHDDFQGEVATFRDSSQSAQFAAVLGALDRQGRMTNLTSITPRRFEIGNQTAVDLSMLPEGTNTAAFALVHPATGSVIQSEQFPNGSVSRWKKGIILIVLLLALVLYFVWCPIRQRKQDDFGFLSRHLPFADPDVGGVAGVALLAEQLRKSNDALCVMLRKRLDEILAAIKVSRPDAPAGEQEASAFVYLLNQVLNHESLVEDHTARHSRYLNEELVNKARPWATPVRWTRPLKRLRQRWLTRQMLDDFLTRLSDPSPSEELKVAQDARLSAQRLAVIDVTYTGFCVLMMTLCAFIAWQMASAIWQDTFARADGEPFSLTSGISAWPNLVLRVLCTSTALIFIVVLFQQLRSMFHTLSRQYRIGYTGDLPAKQPGRVCASQLWRELKHGGQIRWRCLRALIPFSIYLCFGFALLGLLGFPFSPVRGEATIRWEGYTLMPFVCSFLFLSFLTIDASFRCRRFIQALSAAPTDYPRTTRTYYQNKRGDVGAEYLDEWIDIQLIADLTERVDKLLWLPSISFLLMLTARNQYTDHWPWPSGLVILISLNFLLAISSVVILRQAAQHAKRSAETSLYEKVKRLRKDIAVSKPANDADQAEKLLEEIRNLRRGAYVGFWESPIVGAVLLPSGGTALLQVLAWVANR